MNASLARWSGIAGIVAVVLIIISFLAPGSPPSSTDSVAKVSSYFVSHRTGELVGAYLSFVALFFITFWLGGLWWLLQRNSGQWLLPAVAVVGGLLGAAMEGVASAIVAGVAYRAASVHDMAVNTVAVDSSSTAGILATIPFAAMAVAAALQGLRVRTIPNWLIWGSLLFAIVAFLGALAGVSTNKAWLPFAIAGFALFLLWVLATSVLMWMYGGQEDAAAAAEPSSALPTSA